MTKSITLPPCNNPDGHDWYQISPSEEKDYTASVCVHCNASRFVDVVNSKTEYTAPQHAPAPASALDSAESAIERGMAQAAELGYDATPEGVKYLLDQLALTRAALDGALRRVGTLEDALGDANMNANAWQQSAEHLKVELAECQRTLEQCQQP